MEHDPGQYGHGLSDGDEPPAGVSHSLEIFSRRRNDFEQIEIRDYDFKRPERISKEQMRSLQTLHDTFARSFGATVSGLLQTIVEVRVTHSAQMTYSEFISALPNPTCFNLLGIPELDGQICLELSPLVVYPIIDRLLGGASEELFIPSREMTQIEGRLIRTILQRALPVFGEAWQSVRPLTFRLDAMQSNPQIVQIVPPNEVVVVIGFEIKMNHRAGTMSLCIPFKVIEPIIDEISAQQWSQAGPVNRDDWRARIRNRLGGAPLPVAGVLAETTITLAELQQLEKGDVILTDVPATTPVTLAVTGRPKYLAQVGQYKGSRALRVIRPVDSSDSRGEVAAESAVDPGQASPDSVDSRP